MPPEVLAPQAPAQGQTDFAPQPAWRDTSDSAPPQAIADIGDGLRPVDLEAKAPPARARRVLCIIGTRPEIIKMAPVVHALQATEGLAVNVLSSGQHRELLTSVIDWFEVPIDENLDVMSNNQSLSELTARLMRGFEERFAAYQPDLVLAQGDTTTVFCAALACFYRDIPFGHVEAGLRTFDLRNPFPEEFNRVAVTKLAQLHFCPTPKSRENVLAEGIAPAAAFMTGNTSIDSLYFTREKLRTLPPHNFDHDILLTAHRRENFGEPLLDIFGAVLDLCRELPQLKVLYPMHPNPKVRATAEKLLAGHPQITLAEPLDHAGLVAAMDRARVILTDSGGIQEEAPSLGKPVLVLRVVTERPEAVDLGLAKLVGTDRANIVAEARRVLREPPPTERAGYAYSPYGDGKAAGRIAHAVQQYLCAVPAQRRTA